MTEELTCGSCAHWTNKYIDTGTCELCGEMAHQDSLFAKMCGNFSKVENESE